MQLWGREVKARAGADTIIRHRVSRPPSGAVSASVTLISGTVAVGNMTPAWTAPTVNEVPTDRSTLTLAAGVADAAGMAGDYGDAWLVSDVTAPIQVRVVRFLGTTAYLAEPLDGAATLPGGAVGTLVPAWHYVTLTAAAVTGTAQRNALLALSYTEGSGDDSPGFSHVDELDLHIVREPFATGTTEADVLRVDSGLAASSGHRDVNSGDAIDAALEEVIMRLREDLAERDQWEDDVPRQHRGGLARCHAHLAAATLLDPFDPEGAQRHRDKVWGERGLWAAAMRRILIDADGDGLADDGEVVQVTGPRVGSLGTYTTATADDPLVRRNSRRTF